MAAVVAASRRSNTNGAAVADGAQTPPPYREIAQQPDPGVPGSTVITGEVNVEGSKDVLFVNVTEFQGPVTVHQVHEDGRLPRKKFAGDAVDGDIYDEEEDSRTCGMGPYVFRWVVGLIALALIIIVFAVTLGVILNDSGEGVVKTEAGAYDGKDLMLVSRKDWGGSPPVSDADPMALPIPYVIVSHTATDHCLTFEDCADVVRSVQKFHMGSRKWWDIGYNFLVGGDGRAYEARGWDAVGAHARSYNNVSIGLSFIGTFIDVEPPERQVNAAMRLIEEGVRLGKLAEDYGLLGHRQVSPTESPGEKLYQMLKKWPHWTELDS